MLIHTKPLVNSGGFFYFRSMVQDMIDYSEMPYICGCGFECEL